MQVTTPCRNSDTSANKGLKTRLLIPIRDMREDSCKRRVEEGTSFKNFDKKKNRDQHVTAYETYTIICIADLKQKAAVPEGKQTWIGRGRHTPRGERDFTPRRLRGATTSSCPKSEVWFSWGRRSKSAVG